MNTEWVRHVKVRPDTASSTICNNILLESSVEKKF